MKRVSVARPIPRLIYSRSEPTGCAIIEEYKNSGGRSKGLAINRRIWVGVTAIHEQLSPHPRAHWSGRVGGAVRASTESGMAEEAC